LVERFDLRPHPEGGLYRELHRSSEQVLRAGDGQWRSGLTVIAYLLQRGERSRWHRLAGSDELWHHGAGAPLDLWCLPGEGGMAQRLGLGPWEAVEPLLDEPVRVIPAGCWQAACSRGAWSFVYCSVGPGFDFADFELLGDRPLRVARELTKRHEEQVGPTVSAALAHFRQIAPLGECTLVLGGAPEPPAAVWEEGSLRLQLEQLIAAGHSRKDAARVLAESTGHNRRALYALLHGDSAAE
jgi:predicted cupin superfamily sugar epimerase